MSLYSDLAEVLTPYAQRIKSLNVRSIAETDSEFTRVIPERIASYEYYDMTVSIDREYFILNGTNDVSTYVRCALWNYGDRRGVYSAAPTYENVPLWYVPIPDFKVRHTYRYSITQISGTVTDGTPNSAGSYAFLDFRTQADGVISQGMVGEFYCSSLPEMVCVQVSLGTYTDAVFKIEIEDITEIDASKDNTTAIRHATKDRGIVGETNKLSLFFITDLHADSMAIDCLSKYAMEHKAYIDDIVNGGDTAKYVFSSSGNSKYFDSYLGPKALSVIGNHDSAEYENGQYLWWSRTPVEVYNRYLGPYIANWGATQPENAAENGYNYYYKDYTDAGIRVIFLDSMFWDATQCSWLATVLESARISGLSVITVAHSIDGLFTGDIDCDWTFVDRPSETSYSGNYSRFDGTASEAIDDFITAGGEFVCWLTGHSHLDRIGHMTNYPKELVFNMINSGTKMQNMRGAYFAGTMIVVDTTTKMVKLIRCGCNYDEFMREKTVVCYNYTTQKLMSKAGIMTSAEKATLTKLDTYCDLTESEIQQLADLLN